MNLHRIPFSFSYFLLLILLLIARIQAQSPIYCDQKLCSLLGSVRPHIGCPGNAINKCPSNASFTLTTSDKDKILSMHNNYRNTLAGGNLQGFSQAAQMTEIQWDDELASLAKINAGQCTYAHDKCRNTAAYQAVGQNLAWSQGISSNQLFIESAINGWWNEYRNANAAIMASYQTATQIVGHFTQMAQFQANRIGCSTIQYNTERIITCNYSRTNILGLPVYVAGPTANKCKTKSAKYPNLCGPQELVDYKLPTF